MSPAVIVVLVIVVVALAALGLVLMQRQRKSGQLKEKFGPEYDRTVSDRGNRRSAEQDLTERQEHRQKLQLRSLDAVERQQYDASWRQVQTRSSTTPPGRSATRTGSCNRSWPLAATPPTTSTVRPTSSPWTTPRSWPTTGQRCA